MRERLHMDTGDHVFGELALMDRDTLFAIQHLIDLELAFLDRCDQHDSTYGESGPNQWHGSYLETLPQSKTILGEN